MPLTNPNERGSKVAKAVQLHDAPVCKGGLPEFPKFIIRTETVQYGRTRKWKARWLCQCGQEFESLVDNVTRRHTTSCGCVQKERRHLSFPKHGHFIGDKPTPTYKSWQAMLARCTNPKHPAYESYAGRGIKICEAWMTFEWFLADMGERPAGKTLDRYPDNDGNYEPGNCRWATMLEQNRNRRPPKKRKPTPSPG
jgi:hypothetical protein